MARVLILLEPSTCACDSEGNPFGSLAYGWNIGDLREHKTPNVYHQKNLRELCLRTQDVNVWLKQVRPGFNSVCCQHDQNIWFALKCLDAQICIMQIKPSSTVLMHLLI